MSTMPLTTRLKHALADHVPHRLTGPVLRSIMPARSPFKWADHNAKAIFVHVPKTAGTSVKLDLFDGENFGHCRISNYYLFDPQRAERYFKFCFVRNPWDRFLSAYIYLRSGAQRTQADCAFCANYLQQHADFEAFCLALRDDHQRRKIMDFIHFQPQLSWLTVAPNAELAHRRLAHPRLAMDYVGRYETFARDWASIRQKLGLTLGFTPGLTPGLTGEKAPAHARASNQRTYQDHYTEQTKQIVGTLYARDIEVFGYRFHEDDAG